MNRTLLLLTIFASIIFSTISFAQTADELIKQAQQLQKAGEYEKAIEAYSEVISIDSTFADAYWFRSMLLGAAEEFDLAIADLETVNKLAPNFADAFGLKGWYLFISSYYTIALEATKTAVKLDPSSSAWTVNLGHLYILLEQPDSAKIYYKRSMLLTKSIQEYEEGVLEDFDMFIESGLEPETFTQLKEMYAREFSKYSPYIESGEFDQNWESLSQNTAYYFINDEYETANIFAEKALVQCEIEFGKNNENYGLSLSNLVLILATLGRYEEAISFHLETLDLMQTLYGEEHPDYAVGLEYLGELYQEAGEYENAVTAYNEALVRLEPESGTVNEDYYDCLSNLIGLYESLGLYAETTDLYIKAFEYEVATIPKDDPNYSASLNNLGYMYQQMGRYEEALPLYLEALEIAEKALGRESEIYSTTLGNLAVLYQLLEENDKAVKYFLLTLENLEKYNKKNSLSYCENLLNFATFYQLQNRFEEAIPLFEETLKIAEVSVGKEHQFYTKALNNLATVYQTMGKYEEAFPLLKESVESAEQYLGKENEIYISTLGNYAFLFQTVGRFKDAVPLTEEALQLAGDVFGENHTSYIKILMNYALLMQNLADYQKAIALNKKAIELAEKVFEKGHYLYNLAQNNLAVVYIVTNDYEKALPLYTEALENIENSVGKDDPSYIVALSNLALLYQRQNEYEKSLDFYLEALKGTEKIFGKSHPFYVQNLNNTGLLYESLGDYDSAQPLYLEANAKILNQIKTVFAFSSEKSKKDFTKMLDFNFSVYQSFYLKSGTTSHEFGKALYNNQLILKGLILTGSQNMLEAISVSGDENLISIYNKWVGIKRQLAEKYSRQESTAKREIDSLENIANELEGELTNLSQDFLTDKQKQNLSWADVRQKLSGDELAIEFASFNFYENAWTDSVFYAAYVITADSEYPEMIYLFEEKELSGLLKNKSPNTIYSSRGGGTAEVEAVDYGSELYKLIFGPLEKYLVGKEKIYFSTDGELHQISFAALPDEEGKLLCEKYDLVQMNSTGKLALGGDKPGTDKTLLVGGVNFEYSPEGKAANTNNYDYTYLEDAQSKRSKSAHSRGDAWNYLPGTKIEVESLSKIFSSKNLNAEVLTGKFADEKAIKNLDGKSPKVLHIATHGFFFENPETKKEDLNLGEEQSYVISEDPLMRSGLILAGGNYTWKNGSNPYEKEDGILTAYEISNLNLMNTDLVALSACETGLGDIEGSEGVYGLQRAFRMAGVDYLIMSLWQVPDAETVEFMETFYTNWLGGMPIRDAFNRTQKVMSAEYRNEPEKWAAFVMLE